VIQLIRCERVAGGQSVNRKTKATGFYREDAALIASQAARMPAQPAGDTPRVSGPAIGSAPDIFLDEPQRPPLTPDSPINQNARALRPAPADLEADDRRGLSLARTVAWIILAPWYVAIAAAALGLNLMFIKNLLGL